MNDVQRCRVKSTIIESIRSKLANYSPETTYMPFHTRLLGRDRMALFSFIQSLNTTFGTSIYEPVAIEVARPFFDACHSQTSAGNIITSEAAAVIDDIIRQIASAEIEVDKPTEIEQIRAVANQGTPRRVKNILVDVMFTRGNSVYLFDIKTVKPNKSNFLDLKKSLLDWVAAYLYQNPQADIHTLIAIPYNPYFPNPYKRWTLRGALDLDYETMIDAEFWDFLGGPNTFSTLLDCFEEAGIELRDEIDEFFSRFNGN